MKTNYILISTFLTLFLIPVLGISQNKKKSDSKISELYQVIETQNFKFEAHDMNTATLGYNSITSGPNTVEIKNDSIFIDLPFWGKAYRADFNNEGGFHTKTVIQSKEKKLTKRKKLIIYTIIADTATDNLKLYFYLSNSEYASLKIISQHKESIDYTGIIIYN